MVVAANPLAARAGRDILNRGGSATDAAIAALLVLNVVEPQSSGLGGGGFLLIHDARRGETTSLDGRETAPAAATPDRFLSGGKPVPFRTARLSGASIGVPGLLRALEAAHERHGRLLWATLFEAAVGHAEKGFAVSPRLAALLAREDPARFSPTARRVFFKTDGTPLAAGDSLRQPTLATTLRRLAREGAGAFYHGPLAQAIVAAARAAPGGSDLTTADLYAYKSRWREPVCGGFRNARVCSMGPPSSGGVTLLQILGLLDGFPAPGNDPLEAWHLLSSASRLAYADRQRFLADSDHVAVPVTALLDPDYLSRRRALIGAHGHGGQPADAGLPGPTTPAGTEPPSTTHVSVVDRAGNAVAVTASIEGAFGSHQMAAGLLLNHQLTDFSFNPEKEGALIANRVAPGKRPRSSMAPTLVYGADGRLLAVLGSPGGSRIIGYVAQATQQLIDGGQPAAALVAAPHVGNRNGATEVEAGAPGDAIAAALIARGHRVTRPEMTSGLQVIVRDADGWTGAADPRREGLALGD